MIRDQNRGSELSINPLMAMYFAVGLRLLARRTLYLGRLAETTQLRHVSAIIEVFRYNLPRHRPQGSTRTDRIVAPPSLPAPARAARWLSPLPSRGPPATHSENSNLSLLSRFRLLFMLHGGMVRRLDLGKASGRRVLPERRPEALLRPPASGRQGICRLRCLRPPAHRHCGVSRRGNNVVPLIGVSCPGASVHGRSLTDTFRSCRIYPKPERGGARW